MAVLIPSIPAELRKPTGFTAQGRATWGTPRSFKVAVVTFRTGVERSSVRADSSASRGRAEELRADGVVLVPADVTVSIGDSLRLLGAQYEVTSVFPRHGLDGALAHNQVELRVLDGG